MQMVNGVLLFGLGAWAALATLALLGLVAYWRKQGRKSKPDPSEQDRELLQNIRGCGIRYEIVLRDLGEHHQPSSMRWQFALMDADAALRSRVYRAEEDPDGKLGVEAPYWVGNSPDEESALAAAGAWVKSNASRERLVLVADPEGPA